MRCVDRVSAWSRSVAKIPRPGDDRIDMGDGSVGEEMYEIAQAGGIPGKVNRRRRKHIHRLYDGVYAIIKIMDDQSDIKVAAVSENMSWVCQK